MPEVQSLPPGPLRPYLFHGVGLHSRAGTSEAVADCPWCSREGKWYVSTETGLWQCKVCGEQGNLTKFLQRLWKESANATGESDYLALAKDRGLLFPETLERWGAVKSLLTGEWLIPGYTLEGKIVQLYRYGRDWKDRRLKLFATTGVGHCPYGVPLYRKEARRVHVCEGPWDGMVLWELLHRAKLMGERLVPTANEGVSLGAEQAVLAVPGCNVFAEIWGRLFVGKEVSFLYDNDHSREHNGREVRGAGYLGTRRAVGVLAKCPESPSSVHYLRWGEEGYDPALPSGFDLRDWLRQGRDLPARLSLLCQLLERVVPIPQEWVTGGRPNGGSDGSVRTECLPCDSWKTLVNSWRRSGLKWIEGLDKALSVMLASIASTEGVGEQLWIKVISPPSGGKTTLCEALTVNKQYVYAKSTLRGFHSGYDDGSGKNHSPLQYMHNKTLVTKDGDALLQSPNLGQILSEGRDVYDRSSRSSYRTGQSKDWEGLNITWLLCGTSSLRMLDSTELGERFLDCVIVEDIDEDLEDEIGWVVANRAAHDSAYRSDGKLETRDSPEMVRAKRLTGGYVGWLRENSLDLVGGVACPEGTLRTIQRWATFVAYIRARPSKRQAEKEHREMAFRLISQFVRLAKFLAVVLNANSVDEEVLRRVRAVALDTARGRTFEIVKRLYSFPDGLETPAAAASLHYNEESEKKFLYFLRSIKVLSYARPAAREGLFRPVMRWRLTPRLRGLYEEIHEDAEGR